MRRIVSVCALGVTAVLLSAVTASAQVVRLQATLLGSNETPAVINTGAFGSADVAVDTENQELTVTLRVFNLPTNATGGHIHSGGPGTGGPVVLDFNVPPRSGDFTMNLRVGAAQFRARPETGIRTLEDIIQAITGGNSYVNVHTTQFPGGEIRGQLNVVTPR